MENKLYLLRHAQSTQNQAAGEAMARGLSEYHVKWSDCFLDAPLSEFGIEQAKRERPAAHALDIQKVYVSPLRRALHTAQIMFEGHPNSPQIIVNPLLTEKIKNAPDCSMYAGRAYGEFRAFDWSFMPEYYYLFDIFA